MERKCGFRHLGRHGGDANSTPPVLTNDFVDGWFTILKKLRSEVIALGKPVVLLRGDSHHFMVDRPLVDAHGFRIENFIRVETFGDQAPTTNENHWVKVLVDPKSRDVFAFQPQTVPANPVPYTP